MTVKKENDPIIVFSGQIMEAEIVKSLLENAEIETFLKDEYIGTIAPWYTSMGGGLGSVKVVVSNLDSEKAKLVVADYVKSL